MFETIVQQTVRNDNPKYVSENAPFAVENSKQSYLGAGYYFWDNHIDLAHWWGERHCKNAYIICEGDFKINKEDFCDLVGERKDQIYIDTLYGKTKAYTLNLGQFIEMLKDLDAKNNEGLFPFKAIRAVDRQGNSYEEAIVKFSDKTGGFISLTPRILICLIQKNAEILSNFKIVYPLEYMI